MLKDNVYTESAEYFGASVGVARAIGFTKSNRKPDKYTNEEYKELKEKYEINRIILKAIDTKEYQKLQREIFKIGQTNKRLKKDISIYRKAWQEVIKKEYND